jgi:hypothetical protein
MSNITRFQFEQMQQRVLPRPAPDPPPEKELHQKIMDHCDARWPRWKYIHSRMDRATRNEPGVPDFDIFLPGGKHLLVEAKRPGEKLSPAQRSYHAELAKLDQPIAVIHDLPEFLHAAETTLAAK